MTTGEPRTFAPDTEQASTSEDTFAAMIEGHDDATEAVMDDYPEYRIG